VYRRRRLLSKYSHDMLMYIAGEDTEELDLALILGLSLGIGIPVIILIIILLVCCYCKCCKKREFFIHLLYDI